MSQVPAAVGAGVDWGPALFHYPIKGEMHAGTSSIDMTGRVRPLVLGPYIELPPGIWRAELRISVDPERGHAPLRFEWGARDTYVAAISEVTASGIYTIALDRIWLEPEPAQARIWNYQPVFQGRMEFLGCRVTRMPDDTPETSGR